MIKSSEWRSSAERMSLGRSRLYRDTTQNTDREIHLLVETASWTVCIRVHKSLLSPHTGTARTPHSYREWGRIRVEQTPLIKTDGEGP